MKANYFSHSLLFKKPSGTSRGILTTKQSWFIVLRDNAKFGIGECGILRGLSCDDRPDYEQKLAWVCANISLGKEKLYKALVEFPSIQIGLEMAFLSIQSTTSPFHIFNSPFVTNNESIPINGLVWMGDVTSMKTQIANKIENGFSCIKMKIGAIEFDKEIKLLKEIRSSFTANEIEIRVDANGAFSLKEAKLRLKQLAELEIHSIEQPIKQGNYEAMASLCESTPLPIALDEELIGVFSKADREALLDQIKPQYIILKPSFIGGFKGTDLWIELAEERKIGWWITSALESNIGLNAIAQYTSTKNNAMPQGLGTGQLYINNIESPLKIDKGHLVYDSLKKWNLSELSL